MSINAGKAPGGGYNCQGATQRNLIILRQYSAPDI
jgi:hypothetical protein